MLTEFKHRDWVTHKLAVHLLASFSLFGGVSVGRECDSAKEGERLEMSGFLCSS